MLEKKVTTTTTSSAAFTLHTMGEIHHIACNISMASVAFALMTFFVNGIGETIVTKRYTIE